MCLSGFPSGFFWYGGKRHGPGCPPKWVVNLLEPSEDELPQEQANQAAKQQANQAANQAGGARTEMEAESEIEAESETEPDQNADPPKPESIRGERQMTRQSDRYTLRRRVTPPTRYQ